MPVMTSKVSQASGVARRVWKRKLLVAWSVGRVVESLVTDMAHIRLRTSCGSTSRRRLQGSWQTSEALPAGEAGEVGCEVDTVNSLTEGVRWQRCSVSAIRRGLSHSTRWKTYHEACWRVHLEEAS